MRYLHLLSLLVLIAVAGFEAVEGARRDLQTAGAAITGETQQAQSWY